MIYTYRKVDGGLGPLIHDKLENWGEVILHLASGEVAEIHKGDNGSVSDNWITFVDNRGDEHVILYDQIERVTTHRAAFEE